MKAITKFLAGGIAIAAVASAAPAAAQYYPGYGGYGYPYGGNVVAQVINQALGGGYGYNYGGRPPANPMAVQQCTAAVQQRLGGYGGYGGYGAYGGYGYGPRILNIYHADEHSRYMKIRGLASVSGSSRPEVKFMCEIDNGGYIRDVHIDPVRGGYGGYSSYNGYDYSQYGYRRY